jgi:hypothetical protein
MSTKERLKKQLESARQYSLALLADFHTPEEWVHQVHPNANHALWFAGHMAVSDNFFISNIAPDRVMQKPEFERAFGTGSQPTSTPADYPTPAMVLDVMKERRQTLLELLDRMDESDFSKATPKGTPDFLPDLSSIFETAVWHEGLHSGQLSVCRRAMGHKPIMPQPRG